MTDLKERFTALRPRIDAATDDALACMVRRLDPSTGCDDFIDTCVRATRSGKRFRGLLAYVGASLAGGFAVEDAPVADLAAALELYQASALAHDDLIDHALTRRGAPTPHVRLTGIHRDNGWIGSSADFGAAGAVLVGDMLFSAAEYAMGRQCAALDAPTATRLLDRYTMMHAEVALGQYLDVRAEHLPLDADDPDSLSADDAMEVIVHKSANYSIVHPALLGAIAAGGGDALLTSLSEVLTPWGIAFQLRDDDLGVFGDPATTGKPAGDDLREGKRTVLLALAWKRADEDERRLLARVLEGASVDESDIAGATGVIERRGRDAHEGLIDSLVEEGAAALQRHPFTAAHRAMLGELAAIITARSA